MTVVHDKGNRNIIGVNGTKQTPRDWSGDLQHLDNLAIISFDTSHLDVDLSTLASELTAQAIKTAVEGILAKDDVLRSTRASETTLAAVDAKIASTNSKLDTANTSLDNIEVDMAGIATENTLLSIDAKLDTLATQATLALIKAQTDKFTFDAGNALKIQNEPNNDVARSTRASEATLSAVSGKLDTANTSLDAIEASVASRATETTALSIDSKLDTLATIDADTGNIAGNTSAANTKLDAANASLDAIEADADATRIAAQAIASSDDVARSTRASEATLSNVKTNTDKLDVTLSELAKRERWGRNLEPAWTDGAETGNPGAGTALVTKAVGAGKTGYIYGFFITSPEANDFKINWTSGAGAKSKRIVHASKGTMFFTDRIPINEGIGANQSTNMNITVVNAGSGTYQAGLLTAEV